MTAGSLSARRFDLVAIVVAFVRGIGWLFVVSATVVLLYVVYLLWFTGLATAQAQSGFATDWQGPPSSADVGLDGDEPDGDRDGRSEVGTGDPVAALRFERDGRPVVADDVLYVVEGVADEQLRDGPGRYPSTSTPGLSGNVAIAGHRTTYGSPFWSLDDLRHGDTIHLVDTAGDEWIYRYVRQEIVGPSETWVLGDDPLGIAAPTLTLTTCHPRHSAAQRLIVFAELVEHRPAGG